MCPLFGIVTSSEIKDRLPRYEDYSQALYTFDIGQNDLHAGIIYMKEDQAKTYIPTMISEFTSVVEVIHTSYSVYFKQLLNRSTRFL